MLNSMLQTCLVHSRGSLAACAIPTLSSIPSRLSDSVSRSTGLSWFAQQQHSHTSYRSCSSSTAPPAASATEPETAGSAKLKKLADEIVGLSILECSLLTDLLRKKLNLQKPAFGGMPMMMAQSGPAPAASAAPAAAAAPEPAKVQTEFEVKLESFSPEGKIKVIKEVRTLTSLGLKEAKELVSVTYP